MYLYELKLWNFRKYGSDNFDLQNPSLIVPFTKGLNVLIGENDSGKTAIIDAIKLVLKTHAYEWIRVEEKDFYKNSSKLRVELLFKDIKPEEGKNFIEWLGWEGEGESANPVLRLIYQVERKNGKILPAEVKAGMDEDGYALNAEARSYLKATYLKPLRDAESDLIAKKNSRLSQILKEHELFVGKEKDHELVLKFNDFNKEVKKWFEEKGKGKEAIKDVIDNFVMKFLEDSQRSNITTGEDGDIKSILEKLTLEISDFTNPGLGTLNRLFMAAELLHLKKGNWDGLRICLIEELEAHLHPQVQMKVVEALQAEKKVQFILTTHSPNLASKVKLHNLILCYGKDVYPLGEEHRDTSEKKKSEDKYTKLEPNDYKFLERFLDITKANLFFAKGVILVEGWSEGLIVPIIADKIGCNLTNNEVSIVNVGSTAYLHYAKIFQRNDEKELDLRVAVITDLDVRPDEEGNFSASEEAEKRISKVKKDDKPVCTFVAKQWTLEWCLYKSKISNEFQQIVKSVHSGTDGFKTDFEKELREKLQTTHFKKVEIASRLAEKISKDEIIIDKSDEWLEYIIKAIKYACRESECEK